MIFRAERVRVASAVALSSLIMGGCAEEVSPSDPGRSVPNEVSSSGPTPPPVGIPADAELMLRMGDEGRPVQVGSAPLEVAVSAKDNGAVTTGAGRDGGSSLDFPQYRPQGAYPKAAVTARAQAVVDLLSPGDREFAYGADFRLDAASEGRPDDNGNNIIQRGLSSDPVMFKVDLDAQRRPGCTVIGSAGSVSVLAFVSVVPGRWYRVKCEKDGEELSIYVSEYLPSGPATTSLRQDRGRMGTLDFDPDVPVSVGGKVARDGSVIQSASDQFNGLVDWAFVALG